MPGKLAGFSKLKYLLSIDLCHPPPVVHDGCVITLATKDKLHREAWTSRDLPEILYSLELELRWNNAN